MKQHKVTWMFLSGWRAAHRPALSFHDELSAGFEYMKRFLNVGQPPASSGWYSFDTSATDKSVDSGEDGSDFASFAFNEMDSRETRIAGVNAGSTLSHVDANFLAEFSCLTATWHLPAA